MTIMNGLQVEFRAIPQFDAGRWKMRLERVPISVDEQSNNTQRWIPQPSQRLLPLVAGDFVDSDC
jgi:hypothetical protein